MIKNVKIYAVAALVAGAPISASAQDWSGFYGGLTAAYAWHDSTHTFSNGAPTGNSDAEGRLLGAFVGYARQSGTMVYGVEMDADISDASGSFINPVGATSGGAAELNWQSSIRGVLGYAGQMFNTPTLFYGTLGYAYGDFDFTGGPAAAATNRYSDELDGWTVGVGMDARLTARSSLRVEYRYTDYGTARGALAPAFPGVVMPVSVEQHALRVGLRIEF